jgi:hypothetical protein
MILFITSCVFNLSEDITKGTITGTPITAKYSYSYYPESKKEGINIYSKMSIRI